MKKNEFNTITGDDWRKSLADSRKRRAGADERRRAAVVKQQPKPDPQR